MTGPTSTATTATSTTTPDRTEPPRDPDNPDLVVDRITADGSPWPVAPGRYRLVAARACPWSHRAVVVRRLLGLEPVISLGLAGPLHDERSWRFHLDPGDRDPVLGIEYLSEAYERTLPGFDGGVTVPALVDVPSGRLVTNDHRTLTVDLCTEWRAHHREGAQDLLPDGVRDDVPALHEELEQLNIAPYRAGMADDQESYEAAFADLFGLLDAFEQRLTGQRYLLGDTLTEPDVRLWTTLVRFDAVYHGHFKCNRNLLSAMPALWGYARDLFTTPGFGDTVDFASIKDHYYLQHDWINPSGLVPVGPDPREWTTPHGRERLGGGPFVNGATPPGPPPAAERVPGGHIT